MVIRSLYDSHLSDVVRMYGRVHSASLWTHGTWCTGFVAVYFSLATVTTLGYGDLTPVSDLGRFMATGEAILGQVLLVTVVARLVTMYSNDTGAATATGKPDVDEAVE